MVKVKICGVRSAEAALAVRDGGADFVGLNFVSWSRRMVKSTEAKELLKLLGTVTPVGVFFDQTVAEIGSTADEVGLEWVQLHGRETPETCAALNRRFKIIKAITIDETFDRAILLPYEPHVELFLFDAPKPGAGEVFSWEVLGTVPRTTPFFLAGGLNPENLSEAISKVQPYGVDTASGVEIAGEQSPVRIAAFLEQARS